MIELRNVHKYFNRGKRNQVHVINDTTIKMEDTGLVAILGPSGCGKTTLLNAIGGLDKIDRGDIYIDNKKLSGKSYRYTDNVRNLQIGYIFQDYKLVENLTVYENVRMQLRMIGIKDENEIEKRVRFVLETLGIYRYRNRLCKMLSGGERQRVGIARAIAKNPRIIIADEPTGNLDSANTIEIMNILKKISEDRLVILVTHEVELAKFYASRIIELKDGKMQQDYENVVDSNLDYKFDNKIYLKDFEKQETLEKNGVKLNFFGDKESKIDVNIVIRHGNIYIETKNNDRVEVIDQNSAIELVDDHYKEINQDTYKDYKFDFDKVASNKYTEKYSSIYSIFTSIKNGFKKLSGYTTIRKLLLVGFLLASMFITYSFSNVYASKVVDEADFITTNRDYVLVNLPTSSYEKYELLKSQANIEYVLPCDTSIKFAYYANQYYQTRGVAFYISADLTLNSKLDEKELIAGRMPENNHEIVIDKLALENLIEDSSTQMVGMGSYKDFLNKVVYVKDMKPFTIVGITDRAEPVVFVDETVSMSLLQLGKNDLYVGEEDLDPSETIYDYKEFKLSYKLKKGKLPTNKYEVIIPYDLSYMYKIGKTLTGVKINDHALKVVGYYTLDKKDVYNTYYLMSSETLECSLVDESKEYIVSTKDKDSLISNLKKENISAEDRYTRCLNEYLDQRRESTRSTIITASIMLIISLIEIYLMMRSSFLSRVKEVGILRAVGVKKLDIYKIFFGETFAISTVASLPGIIIMSYILYHISQIEYLSQVYAMNFIVVFSALFVCYVFNAIVGLIPVFATMIKTPAQILARYDVD